MAISIDKNNTLFKIDTAQSSYILKIMPDGLVAHVYYGSWVDSADVSYLLRFVSRSFSGNPEGHFLDKAYSQDTLPQELGTYGVGDYRPDSLRIQLPNGAQACNFYYRSHRVFQGKPPLEGLPATYGEDAQTLALTLWDKVSQVECTLFYSVIAGYDAIIRSMQVKNGSDDTVYLNRALSCSMDFDHSDFDLITLRGRWGGERQLVRNPLHPGIQSVESTRGTSSHHYNPFLCLCDHQATETTGDCYGFSLVYSGNFLGQVEQTQLSNTRLVLGIHDSGFSWQLAPGDTFTAPEVVMVFSDQGLGHLSHTYHGLYRQHLCRGPYRDTPRPVLLNNWEATYFDFTREKILSLATKARDVGVELLVLDDGWFGKRNDDTSSLGDWVVNEEKLSGSLGALTADINALGLKMGLWFEPEMVSEDSDLYRAHPDWCLQIPGRYKQTSRCQLVLDFSRREVQDAIYDQLCAVLDGANIEYVKWDMNRHLTDVWSATLPANQQGEVAHRYVLGVYSLLDRLLNRYPHILWEGCSGGGGRFDPGMLYYTPQIWTSDNTDAIDRLTIQEGTSLVYPPSTMSAHVSACPNHQTHRSTPLETRGAVAFTGSFGYELDLGALSPEELDTIAQQIARYKHLRHLFATGVYHRLRSPQSGKDAAWCYVSQGKQQVHFTYIQIHKVANSPLVRVRLQGLDEGLQYKDEATGAIYSGRVLHCIGLCIPVLQGDAQAYTVVLQATTKR